MTEDRDSQPAPLLAPQEPRSLDGGETPLQPASEPGFGQGGPAGDAAGADAAPAEDVHAGVDAGPLAAAGPSADPAEADADPPAAGEAMQHAGDAPRNGAPILGPSRDDGDDATGDAPQTGAVEPSAAAMEDAVRLAEALIFASAEPVTPRALTRVLSDDMDADAVLAALRRRYAGRGVELVEAGGGFMFRSAPDLAPRLRKIIQAPRRLPRVAMETLAIIAYHQPVTRAEIEHIRGAALSQQTLDSLLELDLIAPKGRRETPGRPTLWGTTPAFLAHFGLKDLRELPRREDLLLEVATPAAQPEALPPDLAPGGGGSG